MAPMPVELLSFNRGNGAPAWRVTPASAVASFPGRRSRQGWHDRRGGDTRTAAVVKDDDRWDLASKQEILSESSGEASVEEIEPCNPDPGPVVAMDIGSIQDLCFLLVHPSSGGGDGPLAPGGRQGLLQAVQDVVNMYEESESQVRAAWEESAKQDVDPETLRPGSNMTAQNWEDLFSADPLISCLRTRLLPTLIRKAACHGFLATLEGLRRMQNAVLRHVCEGDVDFRTLVTRAMELLNIPVKTLPQDMDAARLFQTIEEDRYNMSLQPADLCLELWGEALQKPKHALKIRRLIETLRRLCKERRPIDGAVTLGLLTTWRNWEVVGLAPEFQARLQTPLLVGRERCPSRDTLFEYVMRNQPVILVDAICEQEFPPLVDFQDFYYLKARCGHRDVRMKSDKATDAAGRSYFLNDPIITINFAEYLDMIEDAERNRSRIHYYMAKSALQVELPELFEDIEYSEMTPLRKYSSCFGDLKTLHTYFGHGRNSTSLHCDPSENLLIVISGSKTIDLFPPYDADCLYTQNHQAGTRSWLPPFAQPGGLPADQEARWPLYCKARPVRVELRAGEMLYLPTFWWHSVCGSAGRNMLLSWWCHIHPDKVRIGKESEDAQSVLNFMAELQSDAQS